MTKNLLLLFLVPALFSCSPKSTLWPREGTTLVATYYALPLSDTSTLLVPDGQVFRITTYPDSLITKHDTIRYLACTAINKPACPLPSVSLIKTCSLNPLLKEYYQQEQGALKLVGYSTGDSLALFTAFTHPLVIIPDKEQVTDSTKAIRQSWDRKKNKFRNETQTTTRVTLLKTLPLLIDGQTEKVNQYQLTLTSDAMMAYGNQSLLVPNAIVMQSNMLVSQSSGLLGEWSFKTRPADTAGQTPGEKTIPERYLEVIIYKAQR